MRRVFRAVRRATCKRHILRNFKTCPRHQIMLSPHPRHINIIIISITTILVTQRKQIQFDMVQIVN